jgi:toxin ParE1/3/4
MTRKVRKRPRVEIDLIEQALFIAETSSKVASRFLAAAEATFSRLAEQSGLGGLYPVENERLQGLRAWRIRGFDKHIVFYLVHPRSIEIVRVLHAARDLKAILTAE